jgi:prophage antirepressor-like protein
MNSLITFVHKFTKKHKSADVEEQSVKANIMNKYAFKKKKETEDKDKKKAKEEVVLENRNQRKHYDDKNIQDEPEVLHLDDNEMFKNETGETMDITVRGKKTQKGAYFNAYDLGKAFDYNRLSVVVADVNIDYVYGKDFIYFYSVFDVRNSNAKQNQTDKNKVLYLTYMGVLKVLVCARGNKAERFHEWTSRILFTIQMGSQEDKVAAEALNVDVSTVTQLFRKSSRAIPCVYLFEVGTVGNMRQHFNLENFKDDNDKVYKYGRTEDMARRAGEHQKKYGKLKDNTFGLTVFSYIDETYVSKAETKLKHYFDNMNVNVVDTKHNELVVINKSKLLTMKELYNDMYIHFSGNNKDLIQQMQEMQLNHKNKLLLKEHENELHRKDYELEKKEFQFQLAQKEHTIELVTLKSKSDLQEAELNYMRQLQKANH